MAVEAYVNLPTPSAPTTGQPTLSGAILAGAVSLVVSSNTNAPAAAPFRCIIDDEIFYVSARPSTTWTVVGAQEGTTAAAHGNGATVVVAGVLTTASLKNNPLALTTTGDLPYLNSSGNQARLAIGSTGEVLTIASGIPAWTTGMTYTLSTNQAIFKFADPLRAGWILFRAAQSAGPTDDFTGIKIEVVSKISDNGLQGANYFNPIYRWSATDLTNVATSFALGSEGNWTNAGGFTEKRIYLWEFDSTGANGHGVFYYQQSSEESASGPNTFNFGDVSTSIDVKSVLGRLMAGGRAMTTQADGFVSAGQFLTTFTKNDANVRTFHVVKVLPTFNFPAAGPGNASTTVNCIFVDTVNTLLTGLTCNLLALSFGGTLRVSVSSAGLFLLSTEAAALPTHANYTDDTAGAGYRGRKFRGTLAAPRRAKQFDTIFQMSSFGGEAADDSSAAAITGGAPGVLRIVAGEAFTSTTHGTYIEILTVPTGVTSVTAAVRVRIDENGLTVATTKLMTTSTALTDGAAASVGTLTNAPAAGNPTKWVPIVDNGTTRYIPAW